MTQAGTVECILHAFLLYFILTINAIALPGFKWSEQAFACNVSKCGGGPGKDQYLGDAGSGFVLVLEKAWIHNCFILLKWIPVC